MRLFIDDPRLPDDVTVADLRDLAERLAREAGELVRSGRPDQVEVAATKSTATDVVTRMDADSEALLRREIAAARPDDAILGEEEGSSSGTSGITWVIDPVDGTVNYLYGVASYAVSVAAVVGPPDPREWTVLAGAVHSVVDDRTWTAGLGAGATLDGRPVRVNAETDLGQCLVGTGFGYDADRRRAQARVLVDVLPQVRDIRRLGSAAIDLCLVATGELDLYYERGLNPWDMAAGALVAQEAGARVTGLRGRPADREMVVAGPPEAVARLVRVLEDVDADRDS
ncbi:myo-inositol-1(or 4)-monophosphatase [Cellulosimicrobium cellulans J34]|uniref:inositol monophosphatase family protein n=1 Tax=Cellulosimicrobium composti TaxID=2672572 RepID=UPI0004B1D6D8|nr:inositol monophosphatase family protein [Cellulosimicrobium composti]TWG87305.1 myo-inositol-1(or 4)-monophosphatase [Cellulosimicrobium cellulans J34]SMF00058.1 myo-inositol-1(or 4)-monophosphatase [Cellulosimicrobium cellulans J1]